MNFINKHKLILLLSTLVLLAGCGTIQEKTKDILYDPVTNDQGEVVRYEPNSTAEALQTGAGMLPVPYADTVIAALLAVGGTAFGVGRKGKKKKETTLEALIKGIEELEGTELSDDAKRYIKRKMTAKAKEYGVADELAKLVSKFT